MYYSIILLFNFNIYIYIYNLTVYTINEITLTSINVNHNNYTNIVVSNIKLFHVCRYHSLNSSKHYFRFDDFNRTYYISKLSHYSR